MLGSLDEISYWQAPWGWNGITAGNYVMTESQMNEVHNLGVPVDISLIAGLPPLEFWIRADGDNLSPAGITNLGNAGENATASPGVYITPDVI